MNEATISLWFFRLVAFLVSLGIFAFGIGVVADVVMQRISEAIDRRAMDRIKELGARMHAEYYWFENEHQQATWKAAAQYVCAGEIPSASRTRDDITNNMPRKQDAKP